MKLEGIDPMHPSMFCVVTVAEVKLSHSHSHTYSCLNVVLWLFCLCQVIGCRLRLHIDGYSECYDFWVNADSPDIRPAGWCKAHNHKLHPPKGRTGRSVPSEVTMWHGLPHLSFCLQVTVRQSLTGSSTFSPQTLSLPHQPCSPVVLESVYS